MSIRTKRATCHPEKLHVAFGLCAACYHKHRYADPVIRETKRAKVREYYFEVRNDKEAWFARRKYESQRRRRRIQRAALQPVDLP